jgi:hypothetical protein
MFNYQAVVRSPTGDILANQNVSFEIVILQTSPTGTPVYTETHNTATNEYGLVTLKIGDGATSDDLSAIDWGADDYFMKVSMDEEGGTNYQEMGITQLLSVPYSLYSETAENIADNSVSSAKILDGEVSDNDIAFNYAASSSKGGPASSLANDVVSSSKILDGEVRAADIGDGATLTEILDDDGPGSGLDADLLDGYHGSYYYKPKIAFNAYNSAGDNFTSSGWKVVEFDTENFDDGANFNNSTDRFIVPYDGVYSFSAAVGVDDVVEGTLIIIGLFVNGSHHAYISREYVNLHDQTYVACGSIITKLNAGDYVEVRVYVSGDTNYYVNNGSYYTYFSGHLVYQY